MNIRYDNVQGFIAEFSTDFNGDLNAVKAAGFRTTGPPSWLWWTLKLPVLDKLRADKPASGLTISEPAYAEYLRLTEFERVNAAARAQFAPIAEKQKAAKKERKKKEIKEQNSSILIIPPKPGSDFDYIGAEDLPPMPPFEHKHAPQPHAGPWCHVCTAPVYPYELLNPPTCIWCEKRELYS